MRRITKGYSRDTRTYATLRLSVALVLVLSVISTVGTIGLQTAFAEKGGEKGAYDHGKGDKVGQKTNQTSTSSSNSTESDEKKKSGKKVSGKESHQSTKQSWKERLNQTADEIHEKHLKMNAGFSGPYTANMIYTLNANGTADAIGNSSYTGEAKLSIDMAVWKSTPGQVKMDVTGGTLTVDGHNMDVHSGHAHYWINMNRMLIIAFVMEGGNNESNADPTNSNETSTSNQTSTESTVEPSDGGYSKHKVRILKLWITIPEGNGDLPSVQSHEPIEVKVMSRQSKLASMSFLEMSGEVALSS